MGMLFNTPGTLRILATANAACSGRNFQALKYGAFNQTNWRNVPLANGDGLYRVIAAVLSIDDNEAKVSARWQQWLGLLDTNNQPGTNPGVPISRLIGNAMADAVMGKLVPVGAAPQANGTFNAIEFYALPSQTMSVAITDYPESASANPTYTKIITVNTQTVDRLNIP